MNNWPPFCRSTALIFITIYYFIHNLLGFFQASVLSFYYSCKSFAKISKNWDLANNMFGVVLKLLL